MTKNVCAFGQYVLEAVHEHLIHTIGEPSCCRPDCLRVVALHADIPHALLTAKRGTLYLSSVKARGLLQLEALVQSTPEPDNRLYRRKSSSIPTTPCTPSSSLEPCPDGVAVVMEVTSACLSGGEDIQPADLLTAARRLSLGEPAQDLAGALDQQDSPRARTEYCCPISRDGGSGTDHPQHTEASITVLTKLPAAQLALSGASLHITTRSSDSLKLS